MGFRLNATVREPEANFSFRVRLPHSCRRRSDLSSPQRNLAISACSVEETSARVEDLVHAAKAGSHEAFGKLQQIYANRLYHRILSITRNREDTEDALQDTFFRAYRSLASFEGRARFSSWLTRIAINSALMILRRRRARPETTSELLPGVGEDSPCFELRDITMDPEQVCDQQQQSRAILHAIQKLDPKSREAIGLWISQEHSMKDLAHHLGVSLASVKARLHRARKRLIRSSNLPSHRTEFMPNDRDVSKSRLQNRA
jgi:RNA polymerase sigma-70 factor, ECF subfamily